VALLDILESDSRLSESHSLANSIRLHLTRLLNSRQGVLPHLKDYGLPDVESIYSGLPYSRDDLAMAIKKVIEKYEPRLLRVSVKPKDKQDYECILRFQIDGVMSNGDTIQMQTYFEDLGKARVRNIHTGRRYAAVF
jgi:type VI secretion system protein